MKARRAEVEPSMDNRLRLSLERWCARHDAVAQAQQRVSPRPSNHRGRTRPRLQPSDSSTPVFKAETRLVLVDTIVTDKKGNYITDLTAKDFKVWEDNKEQPIKSFSAESGSAAPSADHRHYLVLLFDNSTMSFSDQAQGARGGCEVCRDQCRAGSIHGGHEFRRHLECGAKLHGRRRAVKARWYAT